MEAKPVDLEQWLLRKVSWMVEETSTYLDTRELLSLCQTVALINLNKTLGRLEASGELAGIREALAEQASALSGLLGGPVPAVPKKGK